MAGYNLLYTPPGRFDYQAQYDYNALKQEMSSLRIAFQPADICTYDCDYCDWSNKSRKYKWPDSEKTREVVETIHNIYSNPPYNKKIIIWEVLGGEPTVWPQIDQFVELVKGYGHYIQLITNASRNLRWWQANGEMFSHVSISYHPGQADYKHVCAVGNHLAEVGTSVGMLPLMHPGKWDTVVDAIEYFKQHGKFVTEVKPLYSNHDREGVQHDWLYNDAQRQYMNDNPRFGESLPTRENPTAYCSYTVNNRDGQAEFEQVNLQELIVKQTNAWKDWDCYIGIDTLYLAGDGNMRRGAACYYEEGHLGNWRQGNWNQVQWPTTPIRCGYTECSCVHDIRARKIKDG